jgi:hypothetical protein
VVSPPTTLDYGDPKAARVPRCWSRTSLLLVSLIAYRDTFQPFGTLLLNRFQGCGSPCGEAPTQAPPTPGFLGHHHDHCEWVGETTLLIVPVVGFSKPPWSMDLNDFLDTLVLENHPIPCLSHWIAPGPSLGCPRCPRMSRFFARQLFRGTGSKWSDQPLYPHLLED